MIGTLLAPADLAERRVKVGLPVSQIAATLGVAEATVYGWEVSTNFPTAAHLAGWICLVRQVERERLAELLERHWMRG